MSDDNAGMETLEDVIDFVKNEDFFGVVAIGLNEKTSHNRIFQFRPANVSLEEAIVWAMTSFLGGVVSLVGPKETVRLMSESVATVSDLMPYIIQDLNKNKTLQ